MTQAVQLPNSRVYSVGDLLTALVNMTKDARIHIVQEVENGSPNGTPIRLAVYMPGINGEEAKPGQPVTVKNAAELSAAASPVSFGPNPDDLFVADDVPIEPPTGATFGKPSALEFELGS